MTLWLLQISLAHVGHHQSVTICAVGGSREEIFFFFLFNTHTLTKCTQAFSTAPDAQPFSLSFLFAYLFTLFYPFAWTSGNRKWHWPLLIPPITFVKRECGMESHIRGRVVIIFAMPSAWINHSGRLLVEVRSQPWMEPAATLFDWQFW